MKPDSLSRTLAAVADPTRRAILRRLSHGEATVTEIARPFGLSLAAISKHVQVLERAGLVTRSRRAQARPARLRPLPLQEAADWIQACRSDWERSPESRR